MASISSDNTSNWTRVIEAVNKPLGFFVLSLLIVFSFLTSVILASDLPSEQKYNCILIGAALFGLVVILVFIILMRHPETLMYDKEAHLIDRGKVYGTQLKPTTRDKLSSAGSVPTTTTITE